MDGTAGADQLKLRTGSGGGLHLQRQPGHGACQYRRIGDHAGRCPAVTAATFRRCVRQPQPSSSRQPGALAPASDPAVQRAVTRLRRRPLTGRGPRVSDGSRTFLDRYGRDEHCAPLPAQRDEDRGRAAFQRPVLCPERSAGVRRQASTCPGRRPRSGCSWREHRARAVTLVPTP